MPLGALVLAAVFSTALVHHPVTTAVASAQDKFDEGLTLVYAFNRKEARDRFLLATQLDPKLAMAWWGVALAVGPNINERMSADDLARAQEALTKARALESGASAEERRYIEALAQRYPPSLSDGTDKPYANYRDAMAALAADYPADDDAATLYAESMMDLDRGLAYDHGKPSATQTKIADVLGGVLARNPHHVGAAHYWIHAWDYPGYADRALAAAEYLRDLAYEPAASHLQHMPGHTFLDVGDFEALLDVGKRSVLDDDAYAKSAGIAPSALRYYGHNLDFWAGGALLTGDRGAIDAVLAECEASHDARALLIEVRDGRYGDVDAAAQPAKRADRSTWHFARALTALARGTTDVADRELAAFDASLGDRGTSVATDPLSMALHARLAHAHGDDAKALTLLSAVKAGFADDPPEVGSPWFYPIGEWIGKIDLAGGRFAEAEAAFRDDLKRIPNNPRTLFGLKVALEHEGKIEAARALEPEIAAAWRGDPNALTAAL